MKKLATVLTSTGSVLVLVSMTAYLTSTPAFSQGGQKQPSDVRVVNTANQPVPVNDTKAPEVIYQAEVPTSISFFSSPAIDVSRYQKIRIVCSDPSDSHGKTFRLQLLDGAGGSVVPHADFTVKGTYVVELPGNQVQVSMSLTVGQPGPLRITIYGY